MTEEAKKAKREYYKKYRAENAERIKEREKAWRKANPEKVREHQKRYWAKKFQEWTIVNNLDTKRRKELRVK